MILSILLMKSVLALELLERPLPKRHNECQFCHISKNTKFVTKTKETELEHKRIVAKHGNKNLECNHCHDKANHEYLRNTKEFPASFRNTSPVCYRCHVETFRDWELKIHGKNTKSWKAGEEVGRHCIDCHNPHDVKFKEMEAFAPPSKPKFLIQK